MENLTKLISKDFFSSWKNIFLSCFLFLMGLFIVRELLVWLFINSIVAKVTHVFSDDQAMRQRAIYQMNSDFNRQADKMQQSVDAGMHQMQTQMQMMTQNFNQMNKTALQSHNSFEENVEQNKQAIGEVIKKQDQEEKALEQRHVQQMLQAGQPFENKTEQKQHVALNPLITTKLPQ